MNQELGQQAVLCLSELPEIMQVRQLHAKHAEFKVRQAEAKCLCSYAPHAYTLIGRSTLILKLSLQGCETFPIMLMIVSKGNGRTSYHFQSSRRSSGNSWRWIGENALMHEQVWTRDRTEESKKKQKSTQ